MIFLLTPEELLGHGHRGNDRSHTTDDICTRWFDLTKPSKEFQLGNIVPQASTVYSAQRTMRGGGKINNKRNTHSKHLRKDWYEPVISRTIWKLFGRQLSLLAVETVRWDRPVLAALIAHQEGWREMYGVLLRRMRKSSGSGASVFDLDRLPRPKGGGTRPVEEKPKENQSHGRHCLHAADGHPHWAVRE